VWQYDSGLIGSSTITALPYYKFTAESRIFKICQHLAKLWVRKLTASDAKYG